METADQGRPATAEAGALAAPSLQPREKLIDELLDRVWPDTFVEEANLSVNISTVRRVVGR